MKQELIQSVNPVTPKTGSNAGKPMFIINGLYWARTQPTTNDTHLCLEEVIDKLDPSKKYLNVIGYSQDIRMNLSSKIELLKANPEIAGAIATLLR